MKIWHLDFELDKYDNLIPIQSEDWSRLEFDGSSKIAEWNMLEVATIENKPLSDAPGLRSGIPVFNIKAIDCLKYLINDSVEILPLSCKKGDFYAINVTDVLDCVDYQKSKYIKFKSSGRIMQFKKYCFIKEKICNKHIFKIVDETKRRPFVSDEFKQIVEDNNLTGFKFKLLWDSEIET